jgi:hypothetical protein
MLRLDSSGFVFLTCRYHYCPNTCTTVLWKWYISIWILEMGSTISSSFSHNHWDRTGNKPCFWRWSISVSLPVTCYLLSVTCYLTRFLSGEQSLNSRMTTIRNYPGIFKQTGNNFCIICFKAKCQFWYSLWCIFLPFLGQILVMTLFRVISYFYSLVFLDIPWYSFLFFWQFSFIPSPHGSLR